MPIFAKLLIKNSSIVALAGVYLMLAACGDDGSTTVINTTVVSPVAVSSVVPTEARASETITVSGQKFGATQGTSTLSINGITATQITNWSDTQIEATVPVGATTGNVTVTVGGTAGAPGHLVVLWQATNPVNVAVSAAAGNQDGQHIISDGADGSIIVWQDRRNGNVDIYAQRLNNAGVPQWTADGVVISAAAGDQLAPQLVAVGAGGAIIVWQDQRRGTSTAFFGKDSDIYAQRVNSAGVLQWGADGVAISVNTATNGVHTMPQLVADGAGGAILTWSYLLPDTSPVPGGGVNIGILADDIYAQRVNSAGVPQWIAGGVALSAAAAASAFPRLIADGAGGAIMAWMDGRDGGSGFGIYAQRVDGAGLLQWTANGKRVSSINNLLKFYPQLVADGAGGAILAWTAENSGINNGVYAQHVNAAGESQWTAGDVRVSASFDPLIPVPDKQAAQLIPDGVGGAIIAWEQGNTSNTSFDVYAQRVNGAGVTQWASGGVGIATASGNQKAPQLIADGTDGAILVWQDQGSGNYDIYTQHVNGVGVTQWLTATVVSTALGDQVAPQLISNGFGGAIVVWSDSRNGNSDIYAQNISANGRQ